MKKSQIFILRFSKFFLLLSLYKYYIKYFSKSQIFISTFQKKKYNIYRSD
nr:MAG TPA: hypothetical protein [Caudoviricetes sp.]